MPPSVVAGRPRSATEPVATLAGSDSLALPCGSNDSASPCFTPFAVPYFGRSASGRRSSPAPAKLLTGAGTNGPTPSTLACSSGERPWSGPNWTTRPPAVWVTSWSDGFSKPLAAGTFRCMLLYPLEPGAPAGSAGGAVCSRW